MGADRMGDKQTKRHQNSFQLSISQRQRRKALIVSHVYFWRMKKYGTSTRKA